MGEKYPYMGEARNVSSIDNVNTYKKPSKEDRYEFVTHSYEGTGGYLDCEYLEKFDKETSINRRARSVYYKNNIKGIVDSLYVPVFSTEPFRESDNQMYDDFCQDVDLKGSSITQFVNSVIKYSRLHGVCFVVVDNLPSDKQPATLSEAIKGRSYPYCYYVTADDVEDYSCDNHGRLISITFEDGEIIYEGEEFDVYRYWDAEYSVRYIEDENDKIKEIEDRQYHNLGVLPVFGAYIKPDSHVLPHPEVYDLCTMSKRIFNLDSEQTNLSRLCCVPMIAIQTRDHDINLDIGADSILAYGGEYDGSVSAPSWISPDVNILTVLNNLSNELVQKLLDSANSIGATAVASKNTQAKSGVSLQWEFLGQQFALQQSARTAEKTEQMIALIFGLYIKNNIEMTIQYRDNFAPSQQDILDKMNVYNQLLDMNMSPEINATIHTELIKDMADYYKWSVDPQSLVDSIATQNSVI